MDTPPDLSSDAAAPARARAAREVAAPARLAAVRRSGLLDSPAEASFDSLTAVTTRLLKVPACFISIVDAKRDFYKSQCGFPAALAQARELAGLTFCHFTLDRDDALVITDTHADPVWRSVPTVDSLGIRAYVGVPLKAGGENIGSFCVVDMVPRDWSEDEVQAIRQLAISAARELDLRAALDAAEEAVLVARAQALARERMLAVVVHDLRTPLQILQLSASMLQGSADATHDKVKGRMKSAVDMMRSMVDELLTSSSAEASMKPIAAAFLVRDAAEMMAPIAEKLGSTLELEALPDGVISVDYSLMLRVLGNVVGNALKHCPPGSTVRIGGRRTPTTVVLSVADNGPGLSAQELARAFDRGWQGADAAARGDGSGLGLAIVRSLVAQHQGQVRMTSRPGLGTCVTIELPETRC